MAYVQRDAGGNIVGIFAAQQTYAAEYLADDDPAVLGFADPPEAKVDAIRDRRLASGFTDATTGKTWACDPASLTKWSGIGSSAGLTIVMGINPAPTFELIPTDNQPVSLSAADAFALLNGRLMPWVSATILYARTMKNDILAGNPPADIAAGWP